MQQTWSNNTSQYRWTVCSGQVNANPLALHLAECKSKGRQTQTNSWRQLHLKAWLSIPKEKIYSVATFTDLRHGAVIACKVIYPEHFICDQFKRPHWMPVLVKDGYVYIKQLNFLDLSQEETERKFTFEEVYSQSTIRFRVNCKLTWFQKLQIWQRKCQCLNSLTPIWRVCKATSRRRWCSAWLSLNVKTKKQ